MSCTRLNSFCVKEGANQMSGPISDLEERAESGDADALFELVEKYRKEGDMVAFEHWLNRAFDVGDEGLVEDAIMGLVRYYEENGLEQKATVFYDKVEQLQDHYSAEEVASVLKDLNLLDKAVAWLEKAFAFCEEFSDKWDYSRDIAELYTELGNHEAAKHWSAYSRDDFDANEESYYFDEQSRELVADEIDERTQEGLRPLMEKLRLEEEAKGDFEKKWKWHRAMVGSSAGEAAAMVSLAVLLQGEAPELASEWWEKAALAGNIRAIIKMGNDASNEADFDSAERWWGIWHEAGDESAAVFIAEMLEDQGDTARAIEWLVAGAESGHLKAVNALINLLNKLSDLEGVSLWQAKLADIMSARDEHLESLMAGAMAGAESGDAESIYLLGKIHEDNSPQEVLPWPSKKARDLYLQAAELGNVDAMLQLGRILGWDGDLDSEAKWFKRAGEAGSRWGYMGLSGTYREMYREEEARTALEKAADMGSSLAMETIAKTFFQEGNVEACDEWIARAIAASKAGG